MMNIDRFEREINPIKFIFDKKEFLKFLISNKKIKFVDGFFNEITKINFAMARDTKNCIIYEEEKAKLIFNAYFYASFFLMLLMFALGVFFEKGYLTFIGWIFLILSVFLAIASFSDSSKLEKHKRIENKNIQRYIEGKKLINSPFYGEEYIEWNRNIKKIRYSIDNAKDINHILSIISGSGIKYNIDFHYEEGAANLNHKFNVVSDLYNDIFHMISWIAKQKLRINIDDWKIDLEKLKEKSFPEKFIYDHDLCRHLNKFIIELEKKYWMDISIILSVLLRIELINFLLFYRTPFNYNPFIYNEEWMYFLEGINKKLEIKSNSTNTHLNKKDESKKVKKKINNNEMDGGFLESILSRKKVLIERKEYLFDIMDFLKDSHSILEYKYMKIGSNGRFNIDEIEDLIFLVDKVLEDNRVLGLRRMLNERERTTL